MLMASGRNSACKATPKCPKYWGAYKKKRRKNMVKYYHEKERAVEFTLNIEGDVQRYAMSFLHIWNNARENKDVFYKVENISGSNKVFVTCNKEYRNEAEEYLSQFGEITFEEDINRFVITAEYDKSGWEEIFGDDCEVAFAVAID